LSLRGRSKGKARRKGTERLLHWDPDRGDFVQRLFNGPNYGYKREVYWRQAHSSSTWKEDKIAGIHTQMSYIGFVGVRRGVIQYAATAQMSGRQKVIFGGMECVFWFVNKGWSEVGGRPGSLKRYSEDEIARRSFRGMEDAHRESARVHWKGWREGEGPDLKFVHTLHEVIERRTRS
jgi:hypothetical protein